MQTFLTLTAALAATAAATDGVCDILKKAGNPCVAAHSTTRALYSGYNGPLYNVTRGSDGKSALVGPSTARPLRPASHSASLSDSS